jgi:hypothetical protein
VGDNVDLQKGMPIAQGGFGSMPGKMHHWYVAQSPFVMLIEGDGPFDVNFVISDFSSPGAINRCATPIPSTPKAVFVEEEVKILSIHCQCRVAVQP